MNTKRFTAALAALLLAAALSLGLMLCMLVSAGAETGGPGEWNNYTVVTDEADGSFVGVNIHDDTSAALSAVIPTDAATYAANSDEGFSGAFATITFELEPFCADDYTGMLIQLDRRHARANTGPRFFLEDENGLLYRFNSGSNRSDVLIRADGRVSSWQNEKSRYTLTSVEGTLYVPFTSIISTGTKTPESAATPVASAGAIPAGTVFTKFHYALDTRSNGFYGDTRPTAFGTIAAVSVGETVQVTKLLGVPELSYTVDPADTESDVNLADMTKGKTVYARHTFSGTYVFDENADYIARVNDVLEYDRLPARLTVNYADGDRDTGGWVDDVQHGKGVYRFHNGDVYEGEYVKGQRTGNGIFTFANGNKYVGQFKNGAQDGEGTFTWVGGASYSGSWKTGRRDGEGTYVWSNGDTYEGGWRDGLMDGEGILRLSDGTKFKGTFRHGEKNGFGIMVDAEGMRFEGNFTDNEKDGPFVLKDKDGRVVQEGEYRHGIIVKKDKEEDAADGTAED